RSGDRGAVKPDSEVDRARDQASMASDAECRQQSSGKPGLVSAKRRPGASVNRPPGRRVLAGAYRFLRSGTARKSAGVREVQATRGNSHGVRGVMIITLHRGEDILTIDAFTISVTCLAIYPNISADRPRIKLPEPKAS